MTTYTILADLNSWQRVEIQRDTWDNVRAGIGSSEAVETSGDDSPNVNHVLSGGIYEASQVFLNFDTTGLPEGAAGEAMTLELMVNAQGADSLPVIEASEASPVTGATSDFIPGASLPSSPDWGEATAVLTPNTLDQTVTFTGPTDVTRDLNYTVVFWDKRLRTNVTPTVSDSGRSGVFAHTTQNNIFENPIPTITYVQQPRATAAMTLDDFASAASGVLVVRTDLAVTLDDVTAIFTGLVGFKGDAAFSLADFTCAGTAVMTVSDETPLDRSLSFGVNNTETRSLILSE